MTTRRLAGAVLLAAMLGSHAWGQDIGTVTGREATSWLNRGTGWTEAARAMRVAIGNGLRTESGRLAVLVFGEYRPGDREVFVLERATELTVAGQSGGTRGFALIRAQLDRGGVHWLGLGEVLAPPLGVRAEAGAARSPVCATDEPPEFIVHRYDSGVSEVVVVSGVVQVWNLALDQAPISVRAGQRTQVQPGSPPSEPETLSPEAVQQYLRPFQFVGGGVPEGQAANHRLITGEGIPPPDRAAFRAPASPPGEDERRERAESPPFDQPQPLVTSPQLGIDF